MTELSIDSDQINWKVPVSGSGGNQYHVQFRVAAEVERRLDLLFDNRKLPVKTKSDLARTIFDLGIKVLEQHPDIELGSEWAAVAGMLDLFNVQQRHLAFESTIEENSKLAWSLLQRKAPTEAHRMIHGMLDYIASMPEGELRDMYIKDLFSRFPDVLTDAKLQMTGSRGVTVETNPHRRPASLRPSEASPAEVA